MLLTLAGTPAAPVAVAAPGPCRNALSVVAHEDDDLLFLNPEISDDIAAGRCVTTVYVTSGDAARGPAYWRGREEGEMAAYARMAGRPGQWTEDTLTVDGHAVHRATLAGTAITLLFLRLPDRLGGWPAQTLQLLWLDPATRVRTLDTGQAYDRPALVGALLALLDTYQPAVIRTLDFRDAYGDGDHDDHHTTAYLTWAAQRAYRTPHRTVGHLGYPVSQRPVTLDAARAAVKLGYFLTYAPHDPVVCQTEDWCMRGNYGGYLRRNVPVELPYGAGRNVAAEARVTGSSGDTGTGRTPVRVVDGRLGPELIGEWVTAGQRAGAWLGLAWPQPQWLDRIVLFGRRDPAGRIAGGVLRFDDGSRIRFGPLPAGGAPLTVRFPAKRVRSVRLTVTAATAGATGLAEIRAITADAGRRR
ncbi:hypothetical protein ACWT_1366 [Actinoplanes sp. SE50]|uniref:DUF7402 domain-containing protein n=1 Tax=unclassified Actinoplanes TaxID=2626549 RepID=UPI00023EBE9E|nr:MULTISPECIES: PIG-L family deacetylase [unclassified Actinoplanes]AEV82384.1 hypothetical protein ACPL_1487 [Actinoplanes sp. SE50/110]ATO80781.1 hypothetical protein ACWT_1366 [Actinoplanes sp. SE50]SLL98189.1 hypothetical protein ACSP50_1413 [Actinoplanes sp. SE50/110]